jgi:hypothetical protein
MHASAAGWTGFTPRMHLPRLAAFLFLAFGIFLWADEADARLGRDARFFDSDRAVGLSERALPVSQEEISGCATQPAYPAGSLGDLFSRPGLIGGFAAGFLGAGIFGLLFGHGLIGELSGVPSILGLLFQFALLVALGWLIWAWWRADKSTATAELSLRQLADAYERDRDAGLPELGPDAHGKPEEDGKNSFVGEARLPL